MVSTAAFHARVQGSVPGLGGLKETKKMFLRPQTARDRISNPVSGGQCHLNHLTILVLLAQFSLYVLKGGLKPDSFHFLIYDSNKVTVPGRADMGTRLACTYSNLIRYTDLLDFKLVTHSSLAV